MRKIDEDGVAHDFDVSCPSVSQRISQLVYDVDTNDEKVFCKTLVPETPEPPNKNIFLLAKIKKSLWM
jgi:hypothetical protein